MTKRGIAIPAAYASTATAARTAEQVGRSADIGGRTTLAPVLDRLHVGSRQSDEDRQTRRMTIARSILLFALAAVAEIGGAWLIWQGVREHRGVAFVAAGIVALAAYGFVATLQPDANFGRILAAYGGIFVAGSLLWGRVVDGFEPDRYDLWGAGICLVGVSIIMYAPRSGALQG